MVKRKGSLHITTGQRIFGMFNTILMVFLMFVTLYPFLYVAFASLSDAASFMMHRGMLYAPIGFNLEAYKYVFKDERILTGFRNTLLLLVTKASLAMLLTIVGAYVLSRRKALFSSSFMVVIVITMFFNGGLVPTYLNVKQLGLDNTMGALIFPTLLNTFNLIILRNAFEGIPSDIEEAAVIDGAGVYTTLFKVMLPLVIPTTMVVLLYYSVAIWNSWFDAMIYLRNKSLFPLQLILREILINNNTSNMTSGGGSDVEMLSETIQYAVMMVATIPILLVYPFLQRYFVSGVMVGAVKG